MQYYETEKHISNQIPGSGTFANGLRLLYLVYSFIQRTFSASYGAINDVIKHMDTDRNLIDKHTCM